MITLNLLLDVKFTFSYGKFKNDRLYINVVGEMIPMLGETIRQLREEKGLSQKKLAQRTGVANSTMNLYETNERNPSLSTLIKLSKVLGVSTDYLLGLDSDREETISVSGLSSDEVQVIDLIIETIKARSVVGQIDSNARWDN